MLAAQINLALQTRLEAEALRTGRSVVEVTERAIETYLETAEAKRDAVREAVERADAGHLVEGTEVHAWLESWDSEAEMPIPSVRRTSAAV